MTTKLVTLKAWDPPPLKLYCPFTGSLVISADNPLEIESRLDSLSPYLRFVLFYEDTSYPAFWAANPNELSGDEREFQELVIRHWTTAADVGQAEVTMSGDWYVDYLAKLDEVLPSSSLLLEINSRYVTQLSPEMAEQSLAMIMNPKIHIDWDPSGGPGYTIAASFSTESTPERLLFKRVKTMWDDYIPDFTPGKS